jgi:hypothetical protein
VARLHGATSIDKVVSALTSDPDGVRSYLIHSARTGDGGATAGRMWEAAGGGGADALFNSTSLGPGSTAAYVYTRIFSDGQAIWTFPRPSLTAYHAIVITFTGDPTVDPLVWVDGVAQTITVHTAKTGTFVSTTGGYVLGNHASLDRRWAGSIAEFAVWDGVHAPEVAVALSKGYSPLHFLRGLAEYVPMIRENISYKLAAPTIFNTTVSVHPRIIYPPPFSVSARGAAAFTGSLSLDVTGAFAHTAKLDVSTALALAATAGFDSASVLATFGALGLAVSAGFVVDAEGGTPVGGEVFLRRLLLNVGR